MIWIVGAFLAGVVVCIVVVGAAAVLAMIAAAH